MALTVESGQASSSADSYVHLVDLANYFIARGEGTRWNALSVNEQESIARRASAYVDLQTIFPYSGVKESPLQSMQWPRTGASYWHGGPDIPPSNVPIEVRQAVLDAGYAALLGTLPTESGGGGGAVGGREVKKEKVGDLEVQYFHSTEGQDKGAALQAPFGPSAQNKLALPDVLGRLLPLLREDLMDVASGTGGGVSMAQASNRRAWFVPGSTPPAFERGMHDMHPLAEEKARRKWP